MVSRESNSLMYQLLIHSLIDRAVIEDVEAAIWFCVLFEPIVQHILLSRECSDSEQKSEILFHNLCPCVHVLFILM